MSVDCSVDYERPATPAMTLPPKSIHASELASWLATFGPRAERLLATYPVDPDGTPDMVCCVAGHRDVRRVSGQVGSSLLPIDRFGDSALDELDAITVDSALVGRPARDYHCLLASWLPFPCIEDDALLVAWRPDPSRTSTFDLLPAPIGPGDANDFGNLIATDGASLAGELDPLLLRAPCAGLVRIDRYQHLLQVDGEIAAGLQSRCGRLLVRSSSPLLLGGVNGVLDAASPLAGPATFVFEHVDAETCVDFVGLLLEHHVTAFAALERSPRFRHDVTLLGSGLQHEVSDALVAWIHASSLMPVRSLLPELAAPADVESTIRSALIDHRDPSTADIIEACDVTAASPQGLAAFRAFVAGIYAPVLTGRTLRSIGIDLSNEAGEAAAHLSMTEQTGNKWLVCYAGAPLGRPAETYGPPLGPSVKEWYRGSVTAFDIEALLVLEDQLALDWAMRIESPPATSEEVAEHASQQMGLSTNGFFAAMRVSEPLYADVALSAADWMAETALGHQREVHQEPLYDFTTLAETGHPLADAVDWERRRLAIAARSQMDALADHRIGGSRLQPVSLDWWSRITKWTDSAQPGKWGGFSNGFEDALPPAAEPDVRETLPR
jgi:hypothetical protein